MIKPRHVFIVISAYLVLAWSAVVLVDVVNVFGIRERLDVIMWANLFGNGRVSEWVQWYTLGATALLAMYFAGALRGARDEEVRGQGMFWAVMGVALVLMLIEDAGDVRHEIRRVVELLTGQPRHTGMLDRVVEFSYFVALASVPLYALLRYARHLRSRPVVLVYVLAGFSFYALAAISSATRNWGGWYASVGVKVQETFALRVPEGMPPEQYGHWLIDSLYEETVELFGVMFFLAAAVTFLNAAVRSHRPQAHHAPETGAPGAG